MDGGTGGGLGGGMGGGTGGGTGGGSVTPITFTQYCSMLQSSFCGYANRCGLFESTTGCDELFMRTGGLNCEFIGPSVRDGRVSFDGTIAAGCFAQLSTGCTQLGTCGPFFTGTVPLDGGCFINDDCTSAGYCDSSAMVCPGRCLSRSGVGAFVEDNSACADGLYGAFTRNDAGMFGYVCKTKGTLGQPCSGFNSCVDDLVCNEESGVCETKRGQNSVCNFADGGVPNTSLCQSNLYCQPEATGTRWVCNPPVALGGRCGTCRFDLRCASLDGGAAVCANLSGLNGACTRSSDCTNGLFCKASGSSPFGPGTCQMPGGAGAECNGTFDSCQAGLACNQVSNPDGGLFPVSRCVAGDGGTMSTLCADPTP